MVLISVPYRKTNKMNSLTNQIIAIIVSMLLISTINSETGTGGTGSAQPHPKFIGTGTGGAVPK